MEIIVSHMNIDFDGLASLLAAKKIHPNATVALTDKQQATVKSYLAIYRDRLNFSSYAQIQWEDVQTLIFVDVASIQRTGIPSDRLQSPHTIVYDHHSPKQGDITKGERYIEKVGATITILVEQILKQNVSISPFEATLFGLGLYTDTGNFTYPQVTSRDLQVGANLLEHGMDVTLIESFSDQVLSTDERSLFQTLLTNGVEKKYSGLTVFITTHEQNTYQGGLAALSDKLLEATDCDGVITIVKMKNQLYVVTRASSPRIDFRPMLETFGGGGHAQAGSARIRDGIIDDVYTKVNDQLFLIVKPAITAASIMASPVKSVSPDDAVESVLEQMFQYGHTGFPVIDENDRLVGIISRRDVDKATHHGLGHAPVKGYMSTSLITLPQTASLEEIQATMMKHNIGRIPIMENEKVVGILSRTDVIEQLHKNTEDKTDKEKTYNNLVTSMRSLLPASTMKLLEEIGVLADEKKMNVYLIGGIVRDFFLNRPNEDIDLVVEGDGIQFAKELVKTIGGTVITHDTFGTATWTTPTKMNIDIVTCRTEYYEAPGTLPTVRASNIREDVNRRDFTINAMALRINHKQFGEVLDYYRGQEDVKNKLIRVLHTLSFVEDPTRIFRGVRFALRFNYKFAKQTKKLAIDAAPMLKEVSPSRIYRELNLLIEEGFAYEGMKLLHELSVFPSLFQYEPTKENWTMLQNVTTLEKTNPIYLLTALLFNDPNWLEKVSAYVQTAKQRKLITQLKELRALHLTNMSKLSTMHDTLHSYSTESINLYAHLTTKRFLFSYIKKRKNVSSLLSGNDLIKLGLTPGPEFSDMLHRLTCLQFDDKITTKQEAILWIKQEANITK